MHNMQVHFRLGFLPNFETGTEEWTDSAELISVDRTNVKVLFTLLTVKIIVMVMVIVDHGVTCL